MSFLLEYFLKQTSDFISYFIYKSWLGILSTPDSVLCVGGITVCTATHGLKLSFLYFFSPGFSAIVVDAAQNYKEKLSSRLREEIIEPSMAVTAIIPTFGR